MSNFSKRVNGCLRGLLPAMLAIAIVPVFAQGAAAQSLNFDNNFFVTGDYVVAGAYKINQTVVNGMTTGTIYVPDTQNPNTGAPNTGNTGVTTVPAGAQIVAALLYWETVESTSNTGAGKSGSFGVLNGQSYPITGVNLTGQSTVSWSNGGCPSSSTGRVVSVYRADVRPFLPQDANGNTLPNSTYQVTLPSSSNGSPPITLGATLVIIYRVLSPSVPLNSIVIYDGAYGQTASALIMSQIVQGFYDADVDATRVSRLTHIVGSGQSNKYQTAYLNNQQLPNLYGGRAAFPGWYGDFDNPTWTFDPSQTWIKMKNPVSADDSSATTSVVPSTSQQGCVVWGATIVSTTVNNPDGDGLLKSWKSNQFAEPGYCDAAITSQTSPPVACQGPTDASWVDLAGAQPGHRDVFVQLDYLCSNKVSGQNACDLSQPGAYSFNPFLTTAPDGENVIQKVVDSFADGTKHLPINLHVFPTWAIQEQTCTDANNNNTLCPFPNQPGVVGWKGGLVNVKNQLLKNDGSGDACTDTTGATCVPRFQHGRKDSWHYALFAHGLGQPKWGFLNGLTDANRTASPNGVILQSGNTVTIYTSTAHGFVVSPTAGNGRVTISDAISNLNLNGTFLVTNTVCPTNVTTGVLNDCSVTNTAPGPYEFQIQLATSAGAQPSYTQKTDPILSVAPGQTGTGSGFSDVGGGDSLIALGNWPQSDVTWNVKAGVFMHELGHGLGLTHGGLYYDALAQNPNDYTPTTEANCKPNFLSVMNYAFTVDLLDNVALDYSEELLPSLNEPNGPSTPFTSNYYSETAWFAPTTATDPHAAARHCDGTPILDGANMIRMSGPTTAAGCNGLTSCTSFSWNPPQDINFDGNSKEILRGHSDWSTTATSPGIDLRQIGATGSLSVAGGPLSAGGGPLSAGGGPLSAGGGPLSAGGGPLSAGGGPLSAGGGPGELTHETANSYARPARNANASEGVSPRTIMVSWTAPIFGSPVSYGVYRSDAGAPFKQIATVSGNPPLTSYSDSTSCNPGGYRYYITSVVLDDITKQPLVSQPSNITSNLPLLTGCYTNTPPTVALTSLAVSGSSTVTAGSLVPITWSLQDDDTGVYVQSVSANKTLRAIGPIPYDGACSQLAPPPIFANYQGTYPHPVTTLSTGSGITASSNQFSFTWNTANTKIGAGCYFFELDLDSGQSEVSTNALTLLIWVSGSAPYTLTTTLPNATLNKSYSTTLQQGGGVSPFTWAVVSGALPPGVVLGSASGTLSGKPSSTGIYTFGVKVTDVNKNYGTQTFAVAVCKPSGC